MKLDLTKKEMNLIFANLSFSLSGLTKKQRIPIEKVMTKLHNAALGASDEQ